MRYYAACAVLVSLAFATHGGLFAEVDDDGDDDFVPIVRPEHDVACDLRVPEGASVTPGSIVSTKLVVRNRSRRREKSVVLSVFANAPTGTPLWTDITSLRPHARRTKRVEILVPEGTTSLVAVATCDDDANPGNNMDSEHLGDDDAAPPPASGYAVAGAATYATNCASCHGVDARGTSLAPDILRRSASDVLEAMREGEEGMPRFPSMTWQDAKNLAAYLADPTAATAPTTPPDPPPSGTTPTYTGQVKTLLDSSCVVCHTGSNAPKGVRLDTYAQASTNAAKALAAMQGGTMPPGNPLPASSVQLFADWIAGGKPQ
jgi:mono/diheme cytochrome c family protein